MKCVLAAVTVVVAGLAVSQPSLDACGDKSLSAGGIRMQRAIAARYPASILIYAQPNSRAAAATREIKLQETLQQVGHKYRQVSSLSEAETAAASGRFNVVMADLADWPDLQQRLSSLPSPPVVVPIAYKITKTEADQAAKQCRFLVKAPSRAAEYLTTIAEAIRSREASSH